MAVDGVEKTFRLVVVHPVSGIGNFDDIYVFEMRFCIGNCGLVHVIGILSCYNK